MCATNSIQRSSQLRCRAAGGQHHSHLSPRPQRPARMAAPGPGPGRPALVAFDLDGTMWYPEMYMLNGGAPFRRDASGAVFDAAGERIKLLGDTAAVFSELATDPAWAGVQVAYVSRTEYPEWAVPCLREFLVRGHPQGGSLFDMSAHNEIYPGSKLAHFRAIHKRSGIAYEQMLFFDNERWNVTEVSRLGVKCVYTPRGLTAAAWREGLALFSGGGGGGGASKQQQKQKQAGRAHQ